MGTSASLEERRGEAPVRVGETAAAQPVSGLVSVDTTNAVNGLGRGGFIRQDNTPGDAANATK